MNRFSKSKKPRYGLISLSLTQDNKIKTSLPFKFKTPKDLEHYIETKKQSRKKTKWFASELDLLEKQVYSRDPKESWEKLMFLVTRMRNNKDFQYHIFKDRIFELAKKITADVSPLSPK